MRSKMLWPSLFAVAMLVSACSANIPNLRPVVPVLCDAPNCPDVGAIWQYTNTDERGRMTRAEFIDFLYPNAQKGPAICVSSEEWKQNELSIATLCSRGNCSYEQKKVLERMKDLRARAAHGGK